MQPPHLYYTLPYSTLKGAIMQVDSGFMPLSGSLTSMMMLSALKQMPAFYGDDYAVGEGL